MSDFAKTMDKFLDKIPIDKVYEDVFQPGLKKAGEALSTVLDLSNSILLPIKLLNARSKLVFTENMKRYEKKLTSVEQTELTQVPEYVGIPILDKLTYLSEQNISEAFINLLAKASTEKTLQLVHPSFLTVLNDLSSDEAKILFELREKSSFPFIDAYIIRSVEKIKKPDYMEEKGPKSREQLMQQLAYSYQDKQTNFLKAAWNLTGLEHEIKLDFPKNIDMYLYNFERNKIIEYDRQSYGLDLMDQYEKLEKDYYSKVIGDLKKNIDDQIARSDNEFLIALEIRKGIVEITGYGKCFLEACMNDIQKEAKS